MPGIIGPLHPDPEQRGVPEQLGQAHGNLGADGLPLGQDVVEVLARDAEHPRDLGFGLAGGGDHVLAEQFARMRRAAVGVTAHPRLLVILLEVQHVGVAIAELEGDAPRSVHMDRVAGRVVASQRVKVEAGQVHVLRHGSGIEGVQAPQDAAVHPRVDPRPAGFPEGLQLLVRKGLDHRYV